MKTTRKHVEQRLAELRARLKVPKKQRWSAQRWMGRGGRT